MKRLLALLLLALTAFLPHGGGSPAVVIITHGNGSTTQFSVLHTACNSLVATDTQISISKGTWADYCSIPILTYSPGLTVTGDHGLQFKDQLGGDPAVSGLPYYDAVRGSGTNLFNFLPPSGTGVVENGGTNVTIEWLEITGNTSPGGGSDANCIRVGAPTGAAVNNTTIDHVFCHDANLGIQAGGPSGDITVQNSVVCCTSALSTDPAHGMYFSGSSTGSCHSVTITNSTSRDIGFGTLGGGSAEGHAVKSRCPTTTISHSILATMAYPYQANCDVGLDALELPEGGTVTISHSILEIGPCSGNGDVIRIAAELLGDSYSHAYDLVQQYVNVLNTTFTITGTLTNGSNVISGISSGDMATLNAHSLAGGANDLQYAFFGPITNDPHGQMWSLAVQGSIGCQNPAGDPFLRNAIWKATGSNSITVQCYDNNGQNQATTSVRATGTYSIQVTIFKPDPVRTHSTSISDTIILFDKNSASAVPATAAFTRSPAQITATNVKIVGNPNYSSVTCWGSNNCAPSEWQSYFRGGPPAPAVPIGEDSFGFPSNFPWSSTAGEIIDTGTTVYASRTAANTGGLFAGTSCTATTYTCLPLPP